MTTQTLLMIIAALAAGYFVFVRSGASVTSPEAHELVASGALLLDVRTPGEFASGHIEGAVNIPLQELPRRLAELPEKDRAMVLYCRSGARSGQAMKLLQNAGYSGVHNLGGMGAW